MEKLEKKLTDYQLKILRAIRDNLISSISYYKPAMQLGDIAKEKTRDEVLDALRSLEGDFRVLHLDPSIKYSLFNRCGYRVDLEEVKKLYDSSMINYYAKRK